MAQPVHAHAGSLAGSVTDAQILALVAAAEGLSLRQRDRRPDISGEEAEERLRRLDWAVRAGRLVLGDRAARAMTPPGTPAAGTALPRRRL